MVTVTPVYGGLLALMFVALSLRVIVMRRREHIGLGDGSNSALLRRLRVHSNFAEYVPLCLILMALIEMQGLPAWIVHCIGAMLAVGRVIHALGVSRDPELFGFRTIGMALTFTALITASAANLGVIHSII